MKPPRTFTAAIDINATPDEVWRALTDAGELVRWPKDVPHRLWTEGTPMTTLMYERN